MTETNHQLHVPTEDQEQTMTSTPGPFVIIDHAKYDRRSDSPTAPEVVHPALNPAGIPFVVAQALAGGDGGARVLVAFDYPGRVSA